jgi:endo-1,4-beta-xylanase
MNGFQSNNENLTMLEAKRPSLREAARNAEILFGAAVAAESLGDANYQAAIAKHFTMVEPENAMKWATLRPSRDTFDFAAGDSIARLARANEQRLRGHVLAWHAYNPSWLGRGRFQPLELGRLLREHIEVVVDHYAKDVFAWDVVNEAVTDHQLFSMRSSIWYDRPGIGFAGLGSRYIKEIFSWARAVAPDALLFYNDDPTATPRRGTAIRALLADLLDRGAPIDGVGVQLHLSLTIDLPYLEEELQRLSELGLEINVTELDVAVPIDGRVANPGDLERQADIYRRVVDMCLDLPNCTAIQTWGVDDGHSWISTFSQGARGAALLLDHCYSPKPAYHAVTDALMLKSPAATRWGSL